MNTNIFTKLSYGVYVVSSLDNMRPTGCIANCVMQITVSPIIMAVSMNHDNFTNECIRKSGKFSISILSVDCDPSLIGTFGFQSGKDIDKFDGISYEMKDEMPVLTSACGYMTFKVIGTQETDTHTIFLGEMIDGDVFNDKEVMTYEYYHTIIKGKSPKNAPTYLGNNDEITTKDQYMCSVCHYVYDGTIPFEELPDDYVCPICKKPKSVFVKL
ncbi:MAG TPA: flavin reductase [Lachnospiraceae bacterium]|nr:flavin reductase [Lachnospiraceae bacterium]